MSKHTAGPWTLRGTRIELGIVDDCISVPNRNSSSAANARLISAAPELLEALQELTEIVRQYGGMGADPFKYDKIIAKATGGAK